MTIKSSGAISLSNAYGKSNIIIGSGNFYAGVNPWPVIGYVNPVSQGIYGTALGSADPIYKSAAALVTSILYFGDYTALEININANIGPSLSGKINNIPFNLPYQGQLNAAISTYAYGYATNPIIPNAWNTIVFD